MSPQQGFESEGHLWPCPLFYEEERNMPEPRGCACESIRAQREAAR